MHIQEECNACQVLTFKLGNEIFGVDIDQVKEIIDFTDITKVPKMPEYLCGVINLRGNVIPVIDLRIKFDMTPSKKTVDTCVIIIEVNIDDEIVVFGALADSVQEVVDFEPTQLKDAPKLGIQFKIEFIKYMAKVDNKFVIILNIDKVFTEENPEVIAEK